MDGIIILVVLYFVFNLIIKRVRSVNKTKEDQAKVEATKRAPIKLPVTKKKADIRFPSLSTASPQPIIQEGRDPDAELHTYTPISPSKDLESQFSNYQGTVAPSSDLKNQFSDYQGSLGTPASEGAGYHAEAYEPIPVVYSTDAKVGVKVLPDPFTRDTLVQAVVMSEILKRPRACR